MKIFDIYDEENKSFIGSLLYYEKEKTFICELMDDLDEWTAPFLFSGFVRKGIYTIPRDESLNWVKSRIIPPSRQNIDLILKNHKLKEYDEGIFLEISGGKCSQDSMYVKQVKQLPEFVIKRQKKNLTYVIRLSGHGVLCVFADGSVRKVNLESFHCDNLLENDIKKVLANKELFASCKLGTGGYYITFNDSIDIPAWRLYDSGTLMPITAEDIPMMIKSSLADTSLACKMLDCSRQNLSYMIGKGVITPVMDDVKGNLFLKDDIIKSKW